ncbi:MAG: isochorismate synthase MenF [Anaerolineae bacterium]
MSEDVAGVFHRPDRVAAQDERLILLSYSLPWPEMSLVDFLRQAVGAPRVYWESEKASVGFAGYGAAAVLKAAGADRFQVIRKGVARLFDNAILEAIDAPPTVGPRLFGGFSFQAEHVPEGVWVAFPAAYFVLPRYQLTRVEGRHWLTVSHLVQVECEAYRDLQVECEAYRDLSVEGANGRVNGYASRPEGFNLPGRRLDIEYPMGAATWHRLVKDAIRRIDRGELDKVVLARTCDVQVDQPIDPTEVLARLQRRYPDCYRFLIEPVLDHAFYGATPELLVEVTGSALRTVAIAGSIARGDSADADAALAQELMTSPKERQEHAFVVEAIQASLRPLVRQLHVPDRPALRRLHNIQHLQTIIRGELAGGVGVLLAVEALHPTPAVGGVPQTPALQMIAEEEPLPRGWYASPVGWIDPEGNGLFTVAIRSAVSVRNRARLYAGAGIVADSDPEREWEETGLKFRPMLEALGQTSDQ